MDQIMAHPWMTFYKKIPNALPASTMTCKPSSYYIDQFKKDDKDNKSKPLVAKMQVKAKESRPASAN